MHLQKATIKKLHEGLVKGDFSSRDLVESYWKNIDARNGKLNAYLSFTKEQALKAADKVDADIKAGKDVDLVAGIPMAIKDNYNLKGTVTTASSNILKDYISPYTATVVERLIAKDAIILGKTNMDAFAHGSSTEISDFGPTLNPWDESRVPGGSSGGSAAAVAADMCAYALGSETAGSVRGPAAWCGLYGFVPTYGRNSRYGLVAMGSSLDRPGVLANSVEDCALVSEIMAGHDSKDATSIPEAKVEYLKNLNSKLKKGFKLGVPKQFMDDRIDTEVLLRIKEMIKEFEKLGAEIVELDFLDPKYTMAVYTIVCRSEVSSNLARIDGIRYGHQAMEKAANILDQLAANRGEGFGNEAKQRSLTGAYALSAGYYDAYYKKAQQVRTLIIEDFKQAFEKVDLVIGPSMPTVAPKLGVTANNPLFGELADVLTEPSALAGLPCMSVPVGLNTEGLPIGLQIIGPQFGEQAVLNLAYVYEQNIAK